MPFQEKNIALSVEEELVGKLEAAEEEAASVVSPQPEVRPERGEEVGGNGRVGCHRLQNEKDLQAEVSSEAGCLAV